MSKRMQLKLDDGTYLLIMELSELSGISASSLVASMFYLNRDKLRESVRALRGISGKPADVFDELVEVIR